MLHEESRQAFLTITCGGTGLEAARYLRELYEADGQPYPLRIVHLDTDPVTAPYVDQTIHLTLGKDDVANICGSPATFGPTVQTIVEHYPDLLDPENVRNGSRTIRLLTQLAFLYFLPLIQEELNKAVMALRKQGGGLDTIIPVLISSGGGGAGSALMVLLPLALTDPKFKCRVTEGFSDLLERPHCFVIDPYAHSMRHRQNHRNRIMANGSAFRQESAAIEHRKAYRYILHLGLSNLHGLVLDSPEEMAKVLGISVFFWQRHWSLIKSDLVNTVDNEIRTRFGGDNVPEVVLRPRPMPNGTPSASIIPPHSHS